LTLAADLARELWRQVPAPSWESDMLAEIIRLITARRDLLPDEYADDDPQP
jgi:hypothetical protein